MCHQKPWFFAKLNRCHQRCAGFLRFYGRLHAPVSSAGECPAALDIMARISWRGKASDKNAYVTCRADLGLPKRLTLLPSRLGHKEPQAALCLVWLRCTTLLTLLSSLERSQQVTPGLRRGCPRGQRTGSAPPSTPEDPAPVERPSADAAPRRFPRGSITASPC